MPKVKTRKAAAKRFKFTSRGKILHLPARKSHLLEWKPASKKKRLSKALEVAPADRHLVRAMLPGSSY